MREIYPFQPEAVEVFRVGGDTDLILRKNIEKQQMTDDEGNAYTVYACGGTMRRPRPCPCRRKRSWKTG